MSSFIPQIERSELYRELVRQHDGIEIWLDEGFHDEGFDYFWICSNVATVVKNLAYVRLKPGLFEKRTYDQDGDDLWIAVN